jgi:cobalt-zinc-cadmium efflux system outer membrane protein
MTRLDSKILLWVLVGTLNGPAWAAESAPDSLAPQTLEDYLRLARTTNVSLKAAAYRATAAKERVGYAGSFADPRLLYTYHVSPEAMQGRQELELSQEFPFFGKRGLRREVSSRDARAEAHNARAAALDVDFAVKTAFFQYVGLTETAHVLETETDLLRRMRDVAQVRYSSGSSEQQEVLKIELALSRLADETNVNRREIAVTRARLNELLGRSATDSLPDPRWSAPDVSVIDAIAQPDSALARRPDVAIAREEIARADASRRLAKREYWPDFMLGVNYEFGAGIEDWWELMAGIEVPIWIGRRRAMVREAEAMQESAGYQLEAATLRSDREVQETAERARAAWERYRRFESAILPQAEAAFASSEAGYRSGRVDFLDYLDSERMLLEMRREYAMVMAELGMQVAALERAVGER